MIITILIVGIALAWLLHETDFLRVRLPIGTTAPTNNLKPKMPALNTLYKPSEFLPVTMPSTTGNINIICVRE